MTVNNPVYQIALYVFLVIAILWAWQWSDSAHLRT